MYLRGDGIYIKRVIWVRCVILLEGFDFRFKGYFKVIYCIVVGLGYIIFLLF